MGIRESRARALADGHHQQFLSDPTLDAAQRQYMYEIHDPNGPAWTGSYRSFRAGQEARNQIKRLVAHQHGVTEAHLARAEDAYMIRMLCV